MDVRPFVMTINYRSVDMDITNMDQVSSCVIGLRRDTSNF